MQKVVLEKSVTGYPEDIVVYFLTEAERNRIVKQEEDTKVFAKILKKDMEDVFKLDQEVSYAE